MDHVIGFLTAFFLMLRCGQVLESTTLAHIAAGDTSLKASWERWLIITCYCISLLFSLALGFLIAAEHFG